VGIELDLKAANKTLSILKATNDVMSILEEPFVDAFIKKKKEIMAKVEEIVEERWRKAPEEKKEYQQDDGSKVEDKEAYVEAKNAKQYKTIFQSLRF